MKDPVESVSASPTICFRPWPCRPGVRPCTAAASMPPVGRSKRPTLGLRPRAASGGAPRREVGGGQRAGRGRAEASGGVAITAARRPGCSLTDP